MGEGDRDERRFGKAPIVLERTVRKPKGHVLVTDPLGQVDEFETLMCVHCQLHWRIVPGSKKQRGWCFNCGGPTCGKQMCETRCIPLEKAIENLERQGRNQEILIKRA